MPTRRCHNRTTRPCDLSRIVEDTLKLLETRSRQGRCKRVILELASDLPKIFGEEVQIRQLIMNLVLNAIEALDDKGDRLALRTGLAPVNTSLRSLMLQGGANLPDTCVYFEVSDNGVGMSRNTIVRMFDPFFTTKSNGRGLGMAAAQGILRRHGADLIIESTEGVGTKTRVYFPQRCSGDVTRISDTERSVGEAGLHSHGRPILVVDDDFQFRKLLAGQLSELGLGATVAASCQEAVAHMRDDDAYSVAIIDVVMPDCDGWQTLEQLRMINPKLNALMVSGDADAAPPIMLDEYSVPFLTKPFRRNQLVRELGNLGILEARQALTA